MQFDFGKNWTNFARKALDSASVRQAKEHFQQLIAGVAIKDQSFVDIGFGQGLSLLIAKGLGARVVGCDINKNCLAALTATAGAFPDSKPTDIPIVIGSILEAPTLKKLAALGDDGQYDIVHSWGVLHHTGDMVTAIRHAASLVKPGGTFILAIYNRHWSSRAWLLIKWLYCMSPIFFQKVMIALFFPIIWLAKLLVTGRNPLRQERGMNFFYDVIDWVGGYPYEYASAEEVRNMLQRLSFRCEREIAATVPTGCNQFVFRRRP